MRRLRWRLLAVVGGGCTLSSARCVSAEWRSWCSVQPPVAGRRREALLGAAVRGAYNLGALGATDEAAGFYAARGWRQWEGPTSALTPAGLARTEAEDGGIYVLPVAVALDLSGALTCDWRDGDVW